MNADRNEALRDVRSVVVKLGTQVLSDSANRLDADYLVAIARQVAALHKRGVRVTIVSSGAAGSGMAELNLKSRPTDLAMLQAVAAVGQRRLMDAWADAFAPLGLKVGQILLTRDDIDHRTRFLNLRNTIHALHGVGAIPIINENDTVSTDELVKITFGDNDLLAAAVTQALRAELLILLSVVDGVLDGERKRVPLIDSVESATRYLQPTKSALGKGGMNSKLEAARLVAGAGETLVIAHGRADRVIERIVSGEDVGTLFLPARASRRAGKSRWIGSARGKGRLLIDAGAAKALRRGDSSLLPAGVVDVDGDFDRGQVVDIVCDDQLIARGLTNYTAEQARKILRKRSVEIRQILGPQAYDEIVHRDNLVLVSTPAPVD